MKAFLGESVTLPCMYASWYHGSYSMCWGKGTCPTSGCNEELLRTDGTKVLSRKLKKYELQGPIWRGEVSLTILNTNRNDETLYCCRIEVPGWFNDVKKNIRLKLTQGEHMEGLISVKEKSQRLVGNGFRGRWWRGFSSLSNEWVD